MHMFVLTFAFRMCINDSRIFEDLMEPWMKVQNFQNPELKKFKLFNLQDAYRN